jgi:hypothetical protein
MDFRPRISADLQAMDARCSTTPNPMGLRERLLERPLAERLQLAWK